MCCFGQNIGLLPLVFIILQNKAYYKGCKQIHKALIKILRIKCSFSWNVGCYRLFWLCHENEPCYEEYSQIP